MSMNYSFKHNFHYPSPTPAQPSIPVNPIHATEIPHHPMQYNYHHYRAHRFRRFGLFRRFFWFGLGVGAANWYIYHKQHEIESGQGEKRGWGHWRSGSAHPWSTRQEATNGKPIDTAPTTNQQIVPNPPADQVEHKRFASWAPKTKTIPTAPATPAPTGPVAPIAESAPADDLAALRETFDRILAEKKREMAEVQSRAGVEAKEYARDKLDKLSTILEGLRESLKSEENVKGKKLV